jgi:hypothetical protein
MSIFAVKNDKGLLMDDLGQFKRDRDVCAFHSKSDAKDWADNKHAHVVELTDAPEKVVVSEAEDKVLKKAKNTTVWRPAAVISAYAYDNTKDPDDEALLEDRLMRAYVIGWTVEKPKRYLVRVPHANLHYYYQKCDSGEVIPVWDMETEPPTQFTAAEIDHYGLQDCEKVEVTDDEQ